MHQLIRPPIEGSNLKHLKEQLGLSNNDFSMKKFKFMSFLSMFFFMFSCKSTSTNMNDVECLRLINTRITKELKEELGIQYSPLKKDIKLALKFYVRQNGRMDSIVVARSNLAEMGVSETLIVNSLMKCSYKCLQEVYYSNTLKPNYVMFFFNPDLIKQK